MELSQVLKDLRRRRSLSIKEVCNASKGKITLVALYAYEAGRRLMSVKKAELLKEILTASPEERLEFDLAWNEARRGKAPTSLRKSLTTLSLLDLAYTPFSGEPSGFMNKFLKELLNPARISIETRSDNPEAFDIDERVQKVGEDGSTILINLQTPMRMKVLRFLLTPIRISLNGVILQQTDEEIRAARSRLITERKRSENQNVAKSAFTPVAIKHEVGHIYLRETLRLTDSEIRFEPNLNPVALAKKLVPDEKNMLVCDEITALAVVGTKEGPATLVMPPSTDESVLNFEDRRRLPVHYLGFGLRRESGDLFNYLEEVVLNFLSTETEIAAELLQSLYDQVVTLAIRSFNQNNFLYRGGIRRVMNPLRATNLGRRLRDEERVLVERIISALVQQNARAFAKRCLSISRRSIAELPSHLSAWRHALQRARERVLIVEARDRAAVREIVASAMKTILGHDPIDNLDESYKSFFEEATNSEHWTDFKELLERELDIDIPLSDALAAKARERTIGDEVLSSKTNPLLRFEFFVSAIQRLMEENTELPRIISVKCTHLSDISYTFSPDSNNKTEDSSWLGPFNRLWREYCEFRGKPIGPAPERAIQLMAFSLGQAVGFLTAAEKPFCHVDGKELPGVQIAELFVTEVMRKNGISRRMIRSLIDTVQTVQPSAASRSWQCVYVWSEAGVDSKDEALARSGFAVTEDRRSYFYRLYGLDGVELSKVNLVPETP